MNRGTFPSVSRLEIPWAACLLASFAVAIPVRAVEPQKTGMGGEAGDTMETQSAIPGEDGDRVSLAILDFHVPSARVSRSRIHGITRKMAETARQTVENDRCRVLPVEHVHEVVGKGESQACLTAECMADMGRRVGATYLLKGVIASVSGGLMVRLDIRDGTNGTVVASKSLVAARARDLEPVSEWLLLSLLERLPGTGVAPGNLPPPPRHVQAFASLKQLRRVHYVPPQYPRRARRKHVEGVVMVEVVCRANGQVKRVRWLSGNPVFKRSVRKAVREWGFAPQPVDFRFRQPVWFRLETPEQEEALTRATSASARATPGSLPTASCQ